MLKLFNLKSSFEFLYNIYEPIELILVGADAEFWIEATKKITLNKVFFIDADERKVRELKSMISLPTSWILLNALVYEDEEYLRFYELNNSKLNGILSAETLEPLWRNIHEKNHRPMYSKRLKDVIDIEEETSATKCMVIECFGALSILQGTENLLDTTDMVFAKSTLSDNDLLKGISHQKLSLWLKERGFKNIGFIEDNHPEVGISIYVKDVKTEQATFKEEQEKVLKELEAEKIRVVTVQKEKEELSKTFQKKNSEIEELKAEKIRIVTVQKEKEELSKILQKKNSEIEKLKNEINVKIEGNKTLLEELQFQQGKSKKLDLLNQELIARRDKLVKEKKEYADLIIQERKKLEIEILNLKFKNNFYIKPTYKSRTKYVHYNDQDSEDEWQLEVYLHALGLMKKHDYKKVIDIGCGSGYKLMHYLSDYKTIGLELKENLDYLKKKYPEGKWLESDFAVKRKLKTDVLICSDVIEHLVNPDKLIKYIKRISFQYLVLSTPDRDLIYNKDMKFNDGPPRNPAHVREWTSSEFIKYIEKHFEVIDHRVTNLEQGTQMIIAKKRLKV